MEIDFDSKLLWDIWYYFILYGTIVIFALSLLRKFFLYSSLKNKLGKEYQSIPDISKMPKWRKYLVLLMIILSFLMLFFIMIRMESFLYLIPVLLVTGIVYLNGKLKSGFWDIFSTFFFSEKGFCLYPGKNHIFTLSRYNWESIEIVKNINLSSVNELNVKIKNKNAYLKIRCKKQNSEKIKNIFEEKGIAIN